MKSGWIAAGALAGLITWSQTCPAEVHGAKQRSPWQTSALEKLKGCGEGDETYRRIFEIRYLEKTDKEFAKKLLASAAYFSGCGGVDLLCDYLDSRGEQYQSQLIRIAQSSTPNVAREIERRFETQPIDVAAVSVLHAVLTARANVAGKRLLRKGDIGPWAFDCLPYIWRFEAKQDLQSVIHADALKTEERLLAEFLYPVEPESLSNLRRQLAEARKAGDPDLSLAYLSRALDRYRSLKPEVIVRSLPVKQDGNLTQQGSNFIPSNWYVEHLNLPLSNKAQPIGALISDGGTDKVLSWAKAYAESKGMMVKTVNSVETTKAAIGELKKAGVRQVVWFGHGSAKDEALRIGEGQAIISDTVSVIAKTFQGVDRVYFVSCELGMNRSLLKQFALESGAQIIANDSWIGMGSNPLLLKGSRWFVFTPATRSDLGTAPLLMDPTGGNP